MSRHNTSCKTVSQRGWVNAAQRRPPHHLASRRPPTSQQRPWWFLPTCKLLSRSAMLNFQLAQQAEQLFASHVRQFLADNNRTTLLVGGITVIVMTGGRGG